MKISSAQVRAALEAYARAKRRQTAAAPPSLRQPATAQDVRGLENQLSGLPDQRETLVHALRRKIRRGRYFVSSRDIVDALLGRLTADLLNHE